MSALGELETLILMAILRLREGAYGVSVRDEIAARTGRSLTRGAIYTVLRRLEAMLLVGDSESLLLVSGNGDVIEPDDGVAAIGSGGSYALSAARALVRHTSLSVEEVVRESLLVAAEICIYTNDRINVVTMP